MNEPCTNHCYALLRLLHLALWPPHVRKTLDSVAARRSGRGAIEADVLLSKLCMDFSNAGFRYKSRWS